MVCFKFFLIENKQILLFILGMAKQFTIDKPNHKRLLKNYNIRYKVHTTEKQIGWKILKVLL